MEAVPHENKNKYLKAPTWQQIDAYLKELGVKVREYERFMGIPINTIKNVKNGFRELPVKYWHVIYEKYVPTYGSDYNGEPLMKQRRKPKFENYKEVKKPEPPPKQKEELVISEALKRLL